MDRAQYGKKRVVLVIDSDQIRGAKLQKILYKYGFRVHIATDLKEARRRLEENKKIDVALLCLKQFDLSLEQFIKDLQLGKPMIVILESFSEELAASALKAGAADFLTCPIDSKELIQRIGVYARMENNGDYANLRIGVCAPIEKGGSYPGFWKRLFRSLYPMSTEKELVDLRYEKLDRLGIGSFGEVWKVKDVTKDPPNIFVAKILIANFLFVTCPECFLPTPLQEFISSCACLQLRPIISRDVLWRTPSGHNASYQHNKYSTAD